MSNDGGKKDKKKSSASTSGGEKHAVEGDTHDFDSRLAPVDVLAVSLANPGPGSRSSSGASFVSLG